jgi:ribose transport system permease protein
MEGTVAETPSTRKNENILRRIISIPEVGTLIPLIGLIVLFASLNPIFLTGKNIATMLRGMSYLGVIALGEVFLMVSGEFDLSVGSTAGLSAIVCAYMMSTLGLPILPSVIGGLLTGATVGLVNSFVVLKMKVPAFIATLAMLNAARGVNYLIDKGYSIYPLPQGITTFGEAEPLTISWSFVIFLGLAIIFDQVLRRSVHGRKAYAVGGNRELANLAGINVNLIKASGFVLTGIMAAAGGMLLMARIISGEPTIGSGWELNVIAGVVIGGVSLWGGAGTIAGAVIGLLIIAVVNNGLIVINVDPYWQNVALGTIMVGAVFVDLLRRQAKTSAS